MANKYISDLHFGHENILSYDNRQFINIEEHDKHIIDKWSDNVDIDDYVYILGDVSWHNVTKTIEIIKQLNEKKILIIGNHDNKYLKNSEFRSLFIKIENYMEVKDGEQKIILCHYPIVCFNGHYYGNYHLYGHVHISFEYNMMLKSKFDMEKLYNVPCNMYNVGAMLDYMDYTPKTIKEIIDINKEK